jgi:hypothetical protein
MALWKYGGGEGGCYIRVHEQASLVHGQWNLQLPNKGGDDG